MGREFKVLPQEVARAEENDLRLLPIRRVEDVIYRRVPMRPARDRIHVVHVEALREQQLRATGQLLPQHKVLDGRELAEIIVEDEQEPRPRWYVVRHGRELLE